MGDLMQEAFDALKAQRGQSRLTGNQKFVGGANQDEPLYEGYFDAAMKNAQAKRTQAIQQQQFGQQMKFAEKAQKQSNALGWGSIGAQALGYGVKAYMDREKPQALPQTQGQVTSAPALTQSYGVGLQEPDQQYPTFTPQEQAMSDMYNPLTSTTSIMGDWFPSLASMFDIDVSSWWG